MSSRFVLEKPAMFWFQLFSFWADLFLVEMQRCSNFHRWTLRHAHSHPKSHPLGGAQNSIKGLKDRPTFWSHTKMNRGALISRSRFHINEVYVSKDTPTFLYRTLLSQTIYFNSSFLTVDKAVYMVGSYGPRVEEHEFLTPVEEAPKGIIVRANYHIKSYFTDDDKTDHLSWEWNLQIKKDWDSAE